MMTRKALLLVGAFFTAAAVNSGEVQAPAVVPTEKPALVLKNRTIADVQTNEISGMAIGTHMRPRNMIGYNKVMLPAANGQPARLRVEMQMMDSYHLKCIVLELFDGAELPAAVTASVQQQVGDVGGVEVETVEWEFSPEGRPVKFHAVAGTKETIKADLVFLAMGFTGVQPDNPIIAQLGLSQTPRTALVPDPARNIYCVGDCASGASLVVRALASGKNLNL